MRSLKALIILLTAIFAFNSGTAQVRVIKYPKHGAVVTKIHKPKVSVFKNLNYYYQDGVWYSKRHKKYVVVAPASGMVVKRLPRAHRIVRINGKKYYKYRGVYYKKQRRNFVVVTI